MTGWRRAHRDPETVLERRYRRLIGWYPAGYRASNEDEMVAVALARATVGQRWPGSGEAASLMGGGLRVRVHGLVRVVRTDPWGDVLALSALAGAVLLATVYTDSAVGLLASHWILQPERLSVSLIVLGAGWSLVAGAAILRWRLATATGAVLGAIGGAVHLVIQDRYFPAPFAAWWQLVLATVTALAAVTMLARPRAELPVLRWPVLVPMLGAAAALGAFPTATALSTTVATFPDGAGTASNPLGVVEALLEVGLAAALAVTLLVVLIRPPIAALRRRKAPPAS